MNCRLCGCDKDLRVSHIVPKFVFRWMKDSGYGRLRQKEQMNRPLMDGMKTKMLCSDCEQLFSTHERWFSKNIFKPIVSGGELSADNSPHLLLFCLSLSWRVIEYFIHDGNDYTHRSDILKAQSEWGAHLLDSSTRSSGKHYFYIIGDEFNIREDFELYYRRVVDFDIGESDDECFIYTKFANFMFVSEIKGFAAELIEKANIVEQLQFDSRDQKIVDRKLLDFTFTRIDEMPSWSDLSEAQKQKNEAYYEQHKETIHNSAYFKILQKYRNTSA